MTIVLPEIEKAKCQSFTACGRVLTIDKASPKFFSKKRPMIASIKQGRLQRFVRLCFEESGRLHIDVATSAYFQSRWKPEPTHTWPKIQSAMGRFIAQKILVRAIGVFLLPFDRLPESGLIRAMSVESKTPKVTMKLTGGTLSMSGAQIQKIAWSLDADGKKIQVRLHSTMEATVNEMYLVDMFKVLTNALQIFVLSDEKKSNQS